MDDPEGHGEPRERDAPAAPPQPVEALPRPLAAPELAGREAAVAQARERAIRVGAS